MKGSDGQHLRWYNSKLPWMRGLSRQIDSSAITAPLHYSLQHWIELVAAPLLLTGVRRADSMCWLTSAAPAELPLGAADGCSRRHRVFQVLLNISQEQLRGNFLQIWVRVQPGPQANWTECAGPRKTRFWPQLNKDLCANEDIFSLVSPFEKKRRRDPRRLHCCCGLFLTPESSRPAEGSGREGGRGRINPVFSNRPRLCTHRCDTAPHTHLMSKRLQSNTVFLCLLYIYLVNKLKCSYWRAVIDFYRKSHLWSFITVCKIIWKSHQMFLLENNFT